MIKNGNNRLKWLDVVKGIAILLVVFNHVEGAISKGHLLVTPQGMEIVNKIVVSVHMPLFFCISGYSFAHAYIQANAIRMDKWKRQMENLILLYVIWSSIYWSVKVVGSKFVNENVNISDLFLMPVKAIELHWYLYVLIVLYLIIVPINSVIGRKSIFKYLFLGIGGVLSEFYFFVPKNNNITILNVLYYFFFFYMGYFLQQRGREKLMKTTKNSIWVLMISALTFCSIWLLLEDIYDSSFILSTCKLLFITSTILLLICGLPYIKERDNIVSKSLQYLGKHSLEIYLLHIYIVSGMRPIIAKLEISSYATVFLVLMIAGEIVPLLISCMLTNIGIWDIAFRPGRMLKRIKSY